MNILVRKVRSAGIRVRRFFVSQRFGANPAKIYGEEFYNDGGFSKTEHSATVITGWMMCRLAPSSVLDLGSGAGHYLRAFNEIGIRSLGLEASPAGVAESGSTVLAIGFDLRRPVHLSLRFDTVMCIEVAEHIPHRFSRVLVDSICRNAAQYVVFTAAPPGTVGSDHINCQPESFWVSLFSAAGFILREDLSTDLRKVAAANATAEWWQSWAWCFQRESMVRTGDSPDRTSDPRPER